MADHTPDLEELGRRFRLFAEVDCRNYSPLYEELALGIADDPELLGLLARARPGQRRPVLTLAAVNYLNGIASFPEFREFCFDNRDAILEIIETRATQTNEVGRCAILVPLLARLPRPLALVEVGCSAGLNLLFDRYAYDYSSGRILGDSDLVLASDIPPSLVPSAIPPVASRIGIDREPVDVTDNDAVRWLRACVFADHLDRVERLDHAVAIARGDPPAIVAGDAVDVLAHTVAAVPPEGHLVLFHTWVLTYLPRDRRGRFVDIIDALGRDRDLTWISAEGAGVVPGVESAGSDHTVVAEVRYRSGVRTDNVVGYAHPHGAWLKFA